MLTFAEVQSKVLELGGILSGSRLRGDDSPESDWDYWMKSNNIPKLAEWLTKNRHRWDSPFQGGIRTVAEGKQIDICCLFPTSIRDSIREIPGY